MTDDHHDKSFLMMCFISIATEAFRIAEMQCVFARARVCTCVCVYVLLSIMM
jgi:hypothetical protein